MITNPRDFFFVAQVTYSSSLLSCWNATCRTWPTI